MAASFRGLLHFAGFFATFAGKSATTQLVDVALVFSQTEIMFAVAESSDVALSGKATGGGGGAVCFYVFLYFFAENHPLPPMRTATNRRFVPSPFGQTLPSALRSAVI